MDKLKLRIRTRLIFLFVVQVSLILGATGFYLNWRIRRVLEEELGRKLEAVANSLASQLEGELIVGLSPGDEGSRTYRNIQQRLGLIQKATMMRRIYLFDRDRRSLVDTEMNVPIGREYVRLKFDQKELEVVFKGQSVSSVLFEGTDGQLYKSGYAPIFVKGNVLAAVAVEGSAETLKSVRQIQRNLLTLGLVGVVGSAFLAIIFSNKITRPLKRLERSAREIGQGNYQQAIEVKGRDEVAFLARTLEEMRRSIIQRDWRQKSMLAGVAHEIRNPLGGIELFAGLLTDELPDGQAKEAALKILKEVRNLKAIVQSFLDYARPSPARKQACQIKEVFQEVQTLLLPELDKVTIDLIEEAEGTVAFVDPQHLKQIFLNLTKNSLQAMPNGGRIELKIVSENEYVEIYFSDTGSGIPEENRGRIFEPFFTTYEKGTGLGLAIVQSLIEENGGRIQLLPTKGKGATFRIHLPSG
ncbi:MAG: ATP-binding protein [candidate division KSB1 bacterium]|nr:ATP-binding protein [candidate division KSB1 bacterium]